MSLSNLHLSTTNLRRVLALDAISGAGAAVLLSLVLGIIGTSYMAVEASRQRARAEAAMHEAQLQRDRAAEESARAITTRSFLEEMIAAPDPWKLGGGSAETRNVRVVDALGAAASNLERNLQEQPALRGEIATMLGRTLRRLGQLELSRKQLDSAVELLRPLHPESALPRLEAEAQLAITQGELGEFEAADQALTRLLPMIEVTPGLSRDLLIDVRRMAALAANGVGDSARAEQIARDNLQRAAAGSGQESATSGAQAALAEILGELGRWDEAQRLLNEAYTNEQLRHGRSHPTVVALLSLSANLAYHKGDYSLAEQRYREAAALAEQSLGARHPETLRFSAHALLALADGGGAEKSLPEFRAQIALRSEVMGADHPDVLTMRSNYANALRAAGKEADAEAEMEDVFRRRRATLGDGHPETLSAINMLGVIARQRKDFARAEVLFRQASELYLKAKGPLHPESVMMQANYLAAVRDLGRIDEAVAGFSELHRRGEQVFPADHWFLAVIRGHLGLSFLEAGRYAEAEPMLKQSYQTVQAQFGDEDVRSRTFRGRLADLYRRWGKPAEAAQYAP